MAKIITVTPNTAIDMLIEVDGLGRQDNLSAKESYEFACGKGINVAKAVESLGYPVLCLGFAGRQSFGPFSELNSGLLSVDLTAVEGKTRTNITLADREAGLETHIRTVGYRVSRDDCARLIDKLEQSVEAGDAVVFSGSLPPAAPDDLYRILIDVCRRKSATVLLDGSGPGLAAGLEAGPDLVKPNLQELEEWAGSALGDDRDRLAAARSMLGQGAARVCVSLGDKGVLAVDGASAFAACVNACPDEKTRTRIGCGDALVAGLAVGMLRGLPWKDTLKLGVACGTANLYSPEPGRFDKALALQILKCVEIIAL